MLWPGVRLLGDPGPVFPTFSLQAAAEAGDARLPRQAGAEQYSR